jgi:hypothetical protein
MIKHQLASQLIKPVQRIMRYHLLLKVNKWNCLLRFNFQELLRHLSSDKPGFHSNEKGLERMKEVASAVNEIKRRRENETKLSGLQHRLEGYEVILRNIHA